MAGCRRHFRFALAFALIPLCFAMSEAARASEPMPPPPVKGQPQDQIRRDLGILRNLTVSYNLLVWPAGVPIRVCFFPEQRELRPLFATTARKWEEVGNIILDFGEAPQFRTCDTAVGADPTTVPEIRVRFANTLMGIAAGNSAIGLQSLNRPWNQPTMNIATRSPYSGDARRNEHLTATILHEIGHALGLPHEHQHPGSACLMEHLLAAICTQAPARGVDQAKHADLQRKRVDLYRMLPKRFDPVPVWPLPYDVHSIMHYQFLPQHLKGGAASPCYSNRPRTLSSADAARMAILYPYGDIANQRAFLKGQIDVFRQTLKAMGLSVHTGRRLAQIAGRNLHRRHAPEGLAITVDDLGLTTDDTTDLEDQFANPVPPPLPAACQQPVFEPPPRQPDFPPLQQRGGTGR